MLRSSIAALLVFVSSAWSVSNPKPYDFNVFVAQDIGTSASYYHSDFQGLTGAGRDAYFSSFAANTNNPGFFYSVYTGKDLHMTSGSIKNGGLESGGNVYVNSSTIHGNIHAGGDLNGGNGSVFGNVSVGKNNKSNLTISGTVSTHQSYAPTVNLANVTNFFQAASNYYGSQASTATYQNVYGQLRVTPLHSGLNVVNLSVNDLNSAYGIKLTGPADAYVVFNITDQGSAALKAVTFAYSGGIGASDVLFNVLNLDGVTLSGGQYNSILAINSDVTFPSGVLLGNLVAQNLYGGGQVNLGSFVGFSKDHIAVPEPSTYLILTGFVGVLALLKRRKSRVIN